MDTLDKAALILAIIVFTPALLAGGGFLLAGALVVVVVGGLYLGQFVKDLTLQRHSGAAAAKAKMKRNTGDSRTNLRRDDQ